VTDHSNKRLIIVYNRVARPKKHGAAAGGLAVGVLAALREHGGVWFGWSGQLTDTEPSAPEIVSDENIDYATISLNRND